MSSCMGSTMVSTSTLEVTIISAEDLRLGRRHLDRGTFVTVRSGPSVASTVTDAGKSHGYPLWNESLYLSAPPSAGWIQVEIGKRNQVGATAVHVASAKVPVSDFSYGPIGYKHFLSYRLRDQEGTANGIVNLCVRRLAAANEDGSYNVPAPVGYAVPVMAYPVPVGYAAYGKY